MKKTVAICLFLCLAFSLAACGEKPLAPVEQTCAETTPEDPVILTLGIRKSHLVTDYETNYYTQWLEEQTGFELEFQYFTSSAGTEELMVGTMVDNGLELPDLILDIELSKEQIDSYGKEGTLVDLAPYLEDKESVWWQRFEQLPEDSQQTVREAMKSSDGGIYGFPSVEESIIGSMDYQVWINREWLETLKLEMPTDPESLYTVLKAFKEKDPNGNGEADELPLLGSMGSVGGDVVSWIVNMFLYYDDRVLLQYEEYGGIYAPALKDEYRQALQYAHKLYDEGLLCPQSFSWETTDVPNIMEKYGVGILCADVMTGFAPGDPAIYAYEALPLWGAGVINPVQVTMSTFITRDCQNVEAAWELLMVMSSEESSLIQRYGEKDIDWMWANGDSAVMDGVEPQMRIFTDTWTTTGNNNWRTVVATILTNANLEGFELVPMDERTYLLFRMADAMWESYAAQAAVPHRIFPAYGSSMEVQQQISKYRLDFITGKFVDINDDEDWENYVKKFEYIENCI